MSVKSIWVIEGISTVHYANCDEIASPSTPYMTTPKTASEMLAHIARPDTKDKMPGPSILGACQCITLTAERESK